MRELSEALSTAGINSSVDVALETDRGDVLALPTRGGNEAIRLWHQLRRLVDATSHWPVMCPPGSPDPVEEFSVATTIKKSSSIDVAEWFSMQAAERQEDDGYESDEDESWGEPEDGEWPEDVHPLTDFTLPFDVGTRAAFTQMSILLVPTTHPWEVPAFLGFGGWNECPGPTEQCAILKHWHDRYGAELAGAGFDVLEMQVVRPPADQDAAMVLAREQYNYCVDLVDQGCETMSNLAAMLLNGSVWSFWWD